MSRYRRGADSRRNYVFTLDTYRRQALLTHGEVLTALLSATRPFRVEALAVLPNHLHAV